MEFITVYMTAKNKEEAQRLAELLLEKKLVACVNIVENVSSSYLWHGKIEHAKETLVVAKTRASLFRKIKKLVNENHSYDVPCINALPIIDGNESYLKWIYKETK